MKKDFLPNLVIIVATTLLVVVVFYNIYVFVPSIQTTFGNLADWFMVVITAITAVFIYRTLNSQMEVQRDQNLSYQLELKKHRLSIQPEFSFRIDGGNLWGDWESDTYYQTFELFIKSTQPCKFKVIISDKSDLRSTKPLISITHVYPKESKITLKSPDNHIYNFSGISDSLSVGIILDYLDKDYNSYQYKSMLTIKKHITNNQTNYTLQEHIISNKYLQNKT